MYLDDKLKIALQVNLFYKLSITTLWSNYINNQHLKN
mgnify:CR=1 FL=1